jgi:cytochrome P450
MADTDLRGQRLRKGDRLLMLFNAANFDDEVFPDPDRIDFTRRNARQALSFGSGNHRCLGSLLGLKEVQIVIRTVLRRLPDYRIDQARARRFPRAGLGNGWLTMPATFTPGMPLERPG